MLNFVDSKINSYFGGMWFFFIFIDFARRVALTMAI
jgi:hypothetical protein